MNSEFLRIGFIINDPSSDYSKALVAGMQKACYKYGCTLFVFPVGEFGHVYSQYAYQKRAVASFINKNNLDGLIFSTAVHATHVTNEELMDYIKSFSDIPMVSLNGEIPGVPSILVDCRSGMEPLVSHLITKHHCKRIALMSAGENSKEAEERTQVYKNALAKNGIEFDESLVLYGFFSYGMTLKALDDYKAEHHFLDFDAIVCLNDDMAFAVLDYCKQNQIAVPSQLRVTGFDDVAKASQTSITLSSINQQIELQGELSLETLVKVIRNEPYKMIQKVPTKVRYRQSCGCIDLNEHDFDYETEKYTVVSRKTINSSNPMADWLQRKDQLVQIDNYMMNTQGSLNIYEFLGKFQFILTDFSIGAAALVLYDTPVISPKIFTHFPAPESATVLAAYDNSINFNYKRDENAEHFNPVEKILPDNMIHFYNETYFVVALSYCENQYGYLIYKPGAYDEIMYNLIWSVFSSQLHAAIKQTINQEEKAKLDASNKKLRLLSCTDELTQLLNRRGLLEHGQETIDLALRQDKTGMVIFGDMDNLKKINDGFGHDSGDKAIRAIADILRACLRSNDIIARIGGDEFAMVAPGMDINSFQNFKEKVSVACKKWTDTNNQKIVLSISLGYTTFNSDSFALSALLLEADAKQYNEKRLKKAQAND